MSIRLIDTTTLRMKVFVGDSIPKYAILSHTWLEDEEVDFHEMTAISRNHQHPATWKSGYHKIYTTCEKARNHQIRYAWVDSCCIDKSSSAELSEAINSMFKWYRDAEVCYAFLSDLPPDANIETAMPSCRWYQRGWTLQELLAPSDLRFYNSAWVFVGTKSDLSNTIHIITGIDTKIIDDCERLPNIPIAIRMSWASKRKTTRIEDLAYCLLGIFDVNMPLLYGEGKKAFVRLQEEIIKRSNDLSIFWNFCTSDHSIHKASENAQTESSPVLPGGGINLTHRLCDLALHPDTYNKEDKWYSYRTLFAQSPEDFSSCGLLEENEPWKSNHVQDVALTNNGVRFENVRLEVLDPTRTGCTPFYFIRLGYDCDMRCMIVLRKIRPKLFVRCHLPYDEERFYRSDYRWVVETVYILTNTGIEPSIQKQIYWSHSYAIQLEVEGIETGCQDAHISGYTPPESWDIPRGVFFTMDQSCEGSVQLFACAHHESWIGYVGSGYYCLAVSWHPLNSITGLYRGARIQLRTIDGSECFRYLRDLRGKSTKPMSDSIHHPYGDWKLEESLVNGGLVASAKVRKPQKGLFPLWRVTISFTDSNRASIFKPRPEASCPLESTPLR